MVADSTVDVDHIKQLKKDLEKFIVEKDCAPILVRMAWHDSGTYDKDSTLPWPRCGGADGSIRFKPEIDHTANAGLNNATNYLEQFKQKYPTISYADIYQLAAATAIEVSGGPKIPIRFGRMDCPSGDQCPPEGNLPGGGAPFPDGSKNAAQHLRNVFYRMGLNDQEIVVLSGAHTLGRVYKHRSGATDKDHTKYTQKVKEGTTMGGQSWTKDWLKFNNHYYQILLNMDDLELIALETDKALVEDPSFKKYVEKYAASEDVFFQDYAVAQQKLSERGSKFINSNPVTVAF